MRIKSDVKKLIGRRIVTIEGLATNSEEVLITLSDGEKYVFYHDFDCCERVDLHDFELSSHTIAGGTILSAEVISGSNSGVEPEGSYDQSWTWTFYKIETTKGGLWMRWLVTSNGEYSEEVSFAQVIDVID